MDISRNIKYVVINDEKQSAAHRQILTKKAEAFAFPLSQEDLASINALEHAFDVQEKIAGLAAPQIGIAKQAIIFKVPLEMQKWRQDFTHVVPKTLWLNPCYEGIGTEVREDYEACFSVGEVAGRVPRFQKIAYSAYLIDGNKIDGIVEGYLARIIQHEIDHVNGILFTNRTSPDKLLTIEEYQRIRNAKLGD